MDFNVIEKLFNGYSDVFESVLYDSAQIKAGIAKDTEVLLFQQPESSSPSIVTTGASSTYQKTKYHTNNVLNGQIQSGQKLLIRGIGVTADVVDVNVLKQLFLDAQPVFTLEVNGSLKFQRRLVELVDLSSIAMTGFTDGQTSAKAQKMSFAFPSLANSFRFDTIGIMVDPQTTIKAKIKFFNAVSFKSYNVDYGVAGANADFTDAFNLFCSLDCIEGRA